MGSQTQASDQEQPKTTMETPNGLEDWEVVTPSSGGDETDAEKKNASGMASQEKTTREHSSSSGNQEAWDGKIWSKYLSPNQLIYVIKNNNISTRFFVVKDM